MCRQASHSSWVRDPSRWQPMWWREVGITASPRGAPNRSQSRHSSASKPSGEPSRKDRTRGTKPANHRWSQGRRESKWQSEMDREETPNELPARDKQGGEDLWQRYGAERGVWSEAMLVTLRERRIKGNKWFSLIDKAASHRTPGKAWDKVEANAGARGVDGVAISHFGKGATSTRSRTMRS